VTTIFNIRPTTPNIGNDLIATGLEVALRTVFGNDLNVVTIPAKAHRLSIADAGLSARNIYQINQLADGVVIGPGNLFENGALHVETDAVSALGVPSMLLSVSTGTIYDRAGDLVPRTDSLGNGKIQAVCRMTDPLLVRDRATQTHLAELGLDRAQVMGCPTLFLNPGSLALPAPDPAVVGSVLLSLRHPQLMSIPCSLQGRLYQDVGRMIDCLRKQGHERIRFLCHDHQDFAFASAFPDIPAMYSEDPLRFLSWLRDCQLNVTFRLHAFLPCLALGTPSIHLSYDERAMSMIDTVAMSEWDINFVHSKDLIGDLEQRLDSLALFEEIKGRARPVWEHLRGVTRAGLESFAARIQAHKGRRRF
jgi:hypothetical protein